MSTFLTFFPYVLILGPIILVVIERFFTRYVKMSNVISTEKKKRFLFVIFQRTTAGTMKLREFFRLIAKATSKDEDSSE